MKPGVSGSRCRVSQDRASWQSSHHGTHLHADTHTCVHTGTSILRCQCHGQGPFLLAAGTFSASVIRDNCRVNQSAPSAGPPWAHRWPQVALQVLQLWGQVCWWDAGRADEGCVPSQLSGAVGTRWFGQDSLVSPLSALPGGIALKQHPKLASSGASPRPRQRWKWAGSTPCASGLGPR